MITEFDEYSDLPFSKRIQDELMHRHSHRDLPGGSDEIVYTEADVLILLQMMQEEMKGRQSEIKRIKERKHLRYNFIRVASDGSHYFEKDDPYDIMGSLAITYVKALPQPIAEQIWFFGCEDIPDPLPDFLDVMDINPEDFIGKGLDEQDVFEINHCKIEVIESYGDVRIDLEEIKKTPGFRKMTIDAYKYGGKNIARARVAIEI